MDEKQVRVAILRVVRKRQRVAPGQLMAQVGASESLVRSVMEKLIDSGELEVDGELLLTASPCEHKHTHPHRCDDCDQPWCWVCLTYHEPEPMQGNYEGAGVCVDKLRREVAALRSLVYEQREVYRRAYEILQAEMNRLDALHLPGT